MNEHTETNEPARPESKIAKLAGNPVFWIAFIGLAMAGHITRSILSPPLKRPPKVMGSVRPFVLDEHRGRRFGSQDLNGAVWVAALACSSCPLIDPKITGHMQEVQHRSRNLGHRFHMVSVGVDPENDPVEKLAELAKTARASSGRWSFLTGDRSTLRRLVADLYRDPSVLELKNPTGIIVPERGARTLVLVDQAGQVRGHYDLERQGQIDRLLDHAGLLVNVPWRPPPMPSPETSVPETSTRTETSSGSKR